MEAKLQELKNRLTEIQDVGASMAVLGWDQSTYMPPGGANGRGRQLATLEKIRHEMLISPEIGRLLDDLQPYAEKLPYDSDDAALLRVARRQYEEAVKVPPEFSAEFTRHISDTFMLWAQARPENDFKKVLPNLEKTLDMSRELSNYFPGYRHIADPLINFADYGMSAQQVRAVFSQLRAQLVPLVEAITAQEPADDSCLLQHYPEDQQLAFGLNIIKQYGYDFERGRQDKTHHPFMTSFNIGDVRITTRVKENDLSEALFSTLHEAGHAMYEQGINPIYDGLPLADGTSAGVHESQSRLWENIVGRSRAFWEFYYPQLQQAFPQQLGKVSLETFYRAINKVQRSLIRTDADEVTYNLHVMIRFDLELDMLEGKLAIKDLPEAWDARYKSDLGVVSPEIKNGVMQDVHWFGGAIGGAFQGYTLGNIMSAQFYEAALKAHPNIPAQIGCGEFDTLHGWLKDNIYQHGHKFTASELLQRVTGQDLTIEPYIRYLRTKYGELYDLPA